LLKTQTFSVAWRCKPKYGIDNDNLYTRRSNKKHYTHISISFNQQDIIALLFTWQANRYKGKKEPQEIEKQIKRKNEQGTREEREAEGNSNTTRSSLLLVLLLHLAMHRPTRARSARAARR
jgi:hypothetical protein